MPCEPSHAKVTAILNIQRPATKCPKLGTVMKCAKRQSLAAGGYAILRFFTPSPFLSQPQPRIQSHTSSAWIDGLRGLAALFVYTFHFLLPIQTQLRDGYDGEGIRHVFQLPFIRIVYTGSTWVAVFFLLSGYALALKPWKLSREGLSERALKVTSSSCARRPVRLFLPTIVSTFVVMLSTQLGIFEWAQVSGFVSMRPETMSNLWSQYLGWTNFVWTWLLYTWTWRHREPFSNYGAHLWTIPVIMKGSILTYILILVLLAFTRIERRIILVGFILYCYCWSRDDAGLFATGVLLADMEADDVDKDRVHDPGKRPGDLSRCWRGRSYL